MEKFFADEEITIDEIKACYPEVYYCKYHGTGCCAVLLIKNKGVQKLLDAVVEAYMPSPLDVPPIKGTNPETGEEERPSFILMTEPFSALAFKIATDPFVGKLCFFRVYSGTR